MSQPAECTGGLRGVPCAKCRDGQMLGRDVCPFLPGDATLMDGVRGTTPWFYRWSRSRCRISKLEVRSCLSKLYCDPQPNHQQSKIPVPQSRTWAEFVMECRECLVNFWGLFCLSAVLAEIWCVHCMRELVSCCLLRIGPSLYGTALKLRRKTAQRIAMLP